jgi:hypothetical protein
VVGISCFKKFLEMVLRLPHLALEIVFGGRDIHLTGVVGFLVVTVVAGRNDDTLEAPLRPLLDTIGALPSSLDGGLRWCGSAAAHGCFCVAQDEGGPNRLLTRGVSSGDVE